MELKNYLQLGVSSWSVCVDCSTLSYFGNDLSKQVLRIFYLVVSCVYCFIFITCADVCLHDNVILQNLSALPVLT